MCENRESMYGLFLPVRAVPVVRGSWNSKGVSIVIFTAKHSKTANKKGSGPVDLKRFKEESKEKGSPPLQGGNREP